MKQIMRKPVFILVIVLTIGLGTALAGEDGKVMVFAAASTTNAVTDICAMFDQKGLGKAVPSFASSSTLAKQIENGAPAEIYISANVKWMDYLSERGLIDVSTRLDLLGNRIVLIAPLDSAVKEVDIQPSFSLIELLDGGKLAMGDPDHVPAGIYGKQALERLGVWDQVASQVARSKDVRAALALVERGECPLGVVYATDAAISKKVKVVGLFPETSHPAITYPVAIVVKDATPSVSAYFNLLKSPEAKTVFEKYGFSVR